MWQGFKETCRQIREKVVAGTIFGAEEFNSCGK